MPLYWEYSTFTPITPVINGVIPNTLSSTPSVTILGYGFEDVTDIFAQSYFEVFKSYNFRIYSNHIYAGIYNGQLSGPLTLSGLFGTVVTPSIIMLNPTPVITQISAIPSVPGFITLTGLHLEELNFCIYNTKAGTDRYYANYNYTYSKVFLSSEAVSGVLTLTGKFGSIQTPPIIIGNTKPIVIPLPTGTNETTIDYNFKIYPNPGKNVFTIESESGTVLIKNIFGVTLRSLSTDGKLRCEGLLPGWYVIEFINGKGRRKIDKLFIQD